MIPFSTLLKRLCIFVLITALPLALLNAEPQQSVLTAESSEGTLSGDFVIYRDYSWKKPTWIGFLYYDDETYGAFVHTPETQSRVSILFRCKSENNTLTLTGQQIISSITPDDTFAVNYLMTLLPALYEKKLLPHGGDTLTAKTSQQADMYAFGGAVTLLFENTVPLFHLKQLNSAANGTILELLMHGSIKGSGEHTFYEFVPPEPVQAVHQFKRDKKAKKETITLHGNAFTLDSQWTKIADNSFLCGNTAFLTAGVITPPPGGANNAELQLIKLFSSSGLQAHILIPYTVITKNKDGFTMEQSVYDTQLKKINKDIKRCIKNSDGSFTVISLTVDSHAYSKEKKYFNGLFPFF